MIPRFGEPARPNVKYSDRPGAYALLYCDGLMLITHQSDPVPEFQLPGGGIDPGESTLPALHRETLEETGWRIRISRKLGVFRRFTYMPEYGIWARKTCHVFAGRPTLRVGHPTEDFHTPLWVKPEDAAIILEDPGHREFVARFIARHHR